MKTNSIELVESHLQKMRRSLCEDSILPSDGLVIDRMLSCNYDLASFYVDLVKNTKPGSDEYGVERNDEWPVILKTVIDTAAGWNTEKLSALKNDLKEVEDLNADIAKAATKLAELIRRRNRICEKASITRPEDSHPLRLLAPAARVTNGSTHTSGLFSSHAKEHIDALMARFGRKYWPSTADMIDALADAQEELPRLIYDIDQEALEVREVSWRSFLRALNLRLRDLEYLDASDVFSDKSTAAVITCVLDLESPLDADDIKAFRKAEKKRKGLG